MNDDIASLKTRFTPQEGKPVQLDRQLSANGKLVAIHELNERFSARS